MNRSESSWANQKGRGHLFPRWTAELQLLRSAKGRKPLPPGTRLGFCALHFLELSSAPEVPPQDTKALGVSEPRQPRLPCGCHLGLMQSQLALEAPCKLSAEPGVDSFSILGIKGSLPFSTWLSVLQKELLFPLLETGLPQRNCFAISEAMSSPY